MVILYCYMDFCAEYVLCNLFFYGTLYRIFYKYIQPLIILYLNKNRRNFAQKCKIAPFSARFCAIFGAISHQFLRNFAPKRDFCAKLRQNCGLFARFCAEIVDFLREIAPKCGLFARFCAEIVDFLRDFAPFFML